MAFSDIFKAFGAASRPAPVEMQLQVAPGTTITAPAGAQQNTQIPGTQSVPTGTGPAAFPAVGTGDKSPLENYADLFTLDDKQKAPASLTTDYKLDPKAMLESARKVDYIKGLSDAAKEAAKNGDPSLAIQEAVTLAAANSTYVAASMIKNALGTLETKFNTEVMPAKFREFQVSSKISAENPIFDNPAVSPILASVKSALQAKNPTASAEDIAATAKDYILAMSGEIAKANGMTMSPNTKVADSSNPFANRSVEQDWEKLLAG